DQEKAAEREKSPQRLDPRGARQVELALARQVQERRLVQGLAGRRDDHRLELGVDRRALGELPRQPAQRPGPGADLAATAERELAQRELRRRSDRGRAARRKTQRRRQATS